METSKKRHKRFICEICATPQEEYCALSGMLEALFFLKTEAERMNEPLIAQSLDAAFLVCETAFLTSRTRELLN